MRKLKEISECPYREKLSKCLKWDPLVLKLVYYTQVGISCMRMPLHLEVKKQANLALPEMQLLEPPNKILEDGLSFKKK